MICHHRAKVPVIGKIRKNQIQETKNNKKREAEIAIPALQVVLVVRVNKKAKDLRKEATHVKIEQNHIIAIINEEKKRQLHQQPGYSSQTLTLKFILIYLVFN